MMLKILLQSALFSFVATLIVPLSPPSLSQKSKQGDLFTNIASTFELKQGDLVFLLGRTSVISKSAIMLDIELMGSFVAASLYP